MFMVAHKNALEAAEVAEKKAYNVARQFRTKNIYLVELYYINIKVKSKMCLCGYEKLCNVTGFVGRRSEILF